MKPIDIIGLKNFRIFDDENGILEEMTSINILTGANNTGKSSIIKALQMLKNSIVENQFHFDLDLTEQEHLLGDFDNTLFNKDNRNIVISLPFTFLGLKNIYLSLSFTVPSENNPYKAKLRKIEVIDKVDSIALFSFAYIDATDEEIESYKKNFESELQEYDQRRSAKVPQDPDDIFSLDYSFPPFDNLLYGYIEWSINLEKLKSFLKPLLTFYKIYLDQKGEHDFLEKSDALYEESASFIASALVKSFKNEIDIDKWNDFVENEIKDRKIISGRNHVGERDFEVDDYFYNFFTIEDILCDNALKILRKNLNWENLDNSGKSYSVIEECFKNSWKGIIQRILSINYLSNIKEENSRIYIGTLNSPFVNLLKNYNSLELDNTSFIIKYLRAFEIGKEIKVDYEPKYQVIKVTVTTLEDEKRELVDFGYGIKQLILILIKITVLAEKNKMTKHYDGEYGEEYMHSYYNPSLLLIEEPETNLHPKWQSLLGEMFAEANKEFNIQLVIETHSEYLIRKFQALVAEEKIDDKNIKIFYLRSRLKITPTKKQIETTSIQKDGSINYEIFDGGFFDESDKLELSLLNIQRERFFNEFEDLKRNKEENEGKINELELKIDNYINKLDIGIYQQFINASFDTSKLSPITLKYLTSGQFLLNTINDSSDFSPVIIQYGRSIENELKEIFINIDRTKKWMIGIMQGSLEKFKTGTTAITTCSSSELSLLQTELVRIFNSPMNLKINLLDNLRTIRNTAGHSGLTKTKQEALDYISTANEFLERWIDEKK